MTTPSAIFNTLLTRAKSLGLYNRAQVSEFKQAPGPGLSFAVWAQNHGSAPRGSGLASTTAVLQATARQYHPMIHNPQSDVELKMIDAADAYLGALNGGFTLGGLVRNVDLLAEMGTPLTWNFGYITYDQAMYRICDLPIRCVLNDEWTQAE